ncbi:MAPEG family protein [Lysobacter sp. A3-1-A15]|uniref:MAPEG family protein n=1 Tax=Novilysobacter viscosus TaxID=3098602 RepID=UPI002ED9E4AC
MAIELQMLAWSVVLGLVHLLLDGALKTRQRGLKWNVGARDAVVPPLDGVAARVNRAWLNFMETFPFFAAAVLAVVAAGRGDADTALGAQLYFWARVAYIPLYAAGVPYLRSVAWAVSLWGIIKLVSALF